MLGWHLVLVTLHRALQLVLSKTIKISDTKYHISEVPQNCIWTPISNHQDQSPTTIYGCLQ